MQKLAVETVQLKIKYEVGDAIVVVAGQLQGFSGVVESIDIDNNAVFIIISMMGRESKVELALHDIRKA